MLCLNNSPRRRSVGWISILGLVLLFCRPCVADIVSNVTATASSGLYCTNMFGEIIVDRRAFHATVDSGGLINYNGDFLAPGGEGHVWESVGNRCYQAGDTCYPQGDDPAPWIEFTLPKPYIVTTMRVWNFPELWHAVSSMAVVADGTNSLGTFHPEWNWNPAGGMTSEDFQFTPPITASRIRLTILENCYSVLGDPYTDTLYPTTTIGDPTFVGLSQVRFVTPTPPAAVPFTLINPAVITDGPLAGAFQFGFTNTPGASFTAYATTDLSLPLGNWTTLGAVTEIQPGQFQFIDPQATNAPERFYQVRSP